jgi:hypothetical protein
VNRRSETYPKEKPSVVREVDAGMHALSSAKSDFWLGASSNLYSWERFAKRYNDLRLTKEEDRLVAFSGLVDRWMGILGCNYYAGLWLTTGTSYPKSQLCWTIDENAISSHRRSVYCAPSWSWAAVSGKLKFPVEPEEVDFCFLKIKNIIIRPRGPDPHGARRVIR